ncbi:MAG TPA: ABC transporter substrate-binding protein, partial [Methylomirabilota bacterium]|nr:ABC transporter substrate-binding protein [Methylomirabilota bacterium]
MSDRTNDEDRSSSVNRRTFLMRAGTVGAGAVAASRIHRPSTAAAQDATVRPDPAAKRGGTLRYAVHNAPAHFDVHQSGTVANIGPQSPMYDTLLRRSPKDGQTIIPDLAWKWEISPDNKKYTFHLRKGVKFHDGADFTADDVKATYDRIKNPPKGVVIPRTPLFATVSDIVVVNPHTIEFRMSEPRPKAYMLGAFASGWNIIVRKKTLDDNQGNLRQVMAYPGTGPFKHVSRKDKEVWIMERNPDYWNKGLPLVDKLEIYHFLPFTPELGASILSGRVDYARLLDPVSWRKVKETQGMTAGVFNQSVIQAFWTNMEKNKALADPKVRRAIHLAMDRHTLVEVVKDTAPMQVGGFVYPFHEMSTPRAELEKKLGYQKDPKAAVQEAKRLMKEAGYANGLKGLDFVVRDIPTFKLWAVAIQAMLKENLNIESNLRVVQTSVWFDEAQAGNFDLAISAIVSTLMDPSDIFSAWYGKNGPQNYSRWTNAAFHDLASQIEREVDDSRR